MLVIILFVVSVLVLVIGLAFYHIYALHSRLVEIEQKSALTDIGFKNRTRMFLNQHDLEKIENKLSKCFTSLEAVDLFDKAVGAVRMRVEELEDNWKMRAEYFLTKETALDLFKEYQDQCVDEYRKYKDDRWDRLKEAFTRQ